MKKFKGFTFVELAVVLVIIGVIGIIVTAAIRNESNKISQGTVVSKSMSSPNPNPCIKPSFTITIEGEKDGKVVEYTFNVPESEYMMYSIGDWYPKER